VHVWRKNRSTRRKTRTIATSSIINLGWIGLGSNPGLRIERPTTTATVYRKQSSCCTQEDRCNLANNTGGKGAREEGHLTPPCPPSAPKLRLFPGSALLCCKLFKQIFFVLWLSVGSLTAPSGSPQTFSMSFLVTYVFNLSSRSMKFYV